VATKLEGGNKALVAGPLKEGRFFCGFPRQIEVYIVHCDEILPTSEIDPVPNKHRRVGRIEFITQKLLRF